MNSQLKNLQTILQVEAAKQSLVQIGDFNSEIIRNCSMLLYVHDSSLLYADTLAYFTLTHSAEIFLKLVITFGVILKKKALLL